MEQRQNRFFILLGWLHALLCCESFYPMFTVLLYLEAPKNIFYCLLGVSLLIPIIVSWFVVKKLRRLFLYLLLGILFSLGFGILSGMAGVLLDIGFYPAAVPATLLSILLFILREHAYIHHDLHFPDVPHPLHWAFFGIHYIIGALLKNSFYWHAVFYLFFVDVLVSFSFRFFDGFRNFLKMHSRSANLPVKTMQRVSKIVFAVSFILLLLFSLPSLFYGKEPLSMLPDLTSGTDLSPAPAPMELDSEMMSEDEFFFPDASYEPMPAWIEWMLQAFMYLIFVGIAFFLLYLIYKACRRAAALFSAETEDTIVFLDKAPSDAEQSPQKKRLRNMRNLSADQQIRRLYKKTIRRALKQTPRGTETPAELESAAGLSGETGSQLHLIYEKARYSDETCTADELAKTRENLR